MRYQIANELLKNIVVVIIITIALCPQGYGKDFGTQGHLWEISEPDILEYIQQKLQAADMNKLQKEMTEKVKKIVEEPAPVKDLLNCEEKDGKSQCTVKTVVKQRVYYYDPTYVVPEDIYDHNSNMFYKAGYTFNPLTYVPLRERLIFIDGANKSQVEYAFKKRTEYGGALKIILVAGRPLEIQRAREVWMYFDQQGVMTGKLGIKAVPALVEQSALKLKITEIAEEEWKK